MYSIHVLDTCGAMILSYFGITFLLFFMKIENTAHTSLQNSMLLFINGLIFDTMNIQNNQSLEFEWTPMLTPLRSINDRSFSWLCNVSLTLSKIGWILFSIKYVLTERSCQDPLKNWFGRQRSLGSRKDNLSMVDFGYNNNAIRNQNILNKLLMVMLLKWHDYLNWWATSMSET